MDKYENIAKSYLDDSADALGCAVLFFGVFDYDGEFWPELDKIYHDLRSFIEKVKDL